MQNGLKLREYLDRKAFASAPTQVTDAIKPIRLQPVTGPVVVVEPPSSLVVPICFVQPMLLNLTPLAKNIILSALKMAFQNRYAPYHGTMYRIAFIYLDDVKPGSFVARLEREGA